MNATYEEGGHSANYLAPDGYRYGVMFNDGSVMECWNGRTQREQAEHEVRQCGHMFPRDYITLARRRHGEPWTRVTSPGEGD